MENCLTFVELVACCNRRQVLAPAVYQRMGHYEAMSRQKESCRRRCKEVVDLLMDLAFPSAFLLLTQVDGAEMLMKQSFA